MPRIELPRPRAFFCGRLPERRLVRFLYTDDAPPFASAADDADADARADDDDDAEGGGARALGIEGAVRLMAAARALRAAGDDARVWAGGAPAARLQMLCERYVASRVDVASAPRVLRLALDERCDELERALHRFLAHEKVARRRA